MQSITPYSAIYKLPALAPEPIELTVNLGYALLLALVQRFFAVHHRDHGETGIFQELLEPLHTLIVAVGNSCLANHVAGLAPLVRTEQLIISPVGKIHELSGLDADR